jgi:hypothetical protein
MCDIGCCDYRPDHVETWRGDRWAIVRSWPLRTEGGGMKYVVIARAAPGVENQRKALEVFLKAGPAPGSQGLLAGADGKTYIDFVESDEPDMVTALTYAPFFDEFEVIPVVSVDQTWLQAVQAAQANWD